MSDKATIACRIESKNHPGYWGHFHWWSRSIDLSRKSLGIRVNDGLKVYLAEWWMPYGYQPTWDDLHQKLDEIIERMYKP